MLVVFLTGPWQRTKSLTNYASSMVLRLMKMYVDPRHVLQPEIYFVLQTTEEVEEAIKKGLPAERPVSSTTHLPCECLGLMMETAT